MLFLWVDYGNVFLSFGLESNKFSKTRIYDLHPTDIQITIKHTNKDKNQQNYNLQLKF